MGLVLALDIGGTNTRAALVDENYDIKGIEIRPTLRGDREAFLENIKKTIEMLGDDVRDVKAIAGGVPGRVRYDGYVYALPNVGVSEIPIAEYLAKEFGKPSYIINDAEAAVLGEANIGSWKKFPSIFFITVSTGVGAALARNGKLLSSSYEAGHTLIPYQGRLYEFERLCSGEGLKRLSALNGLSIESAKDFFALVSGKNPLALKVYEDWLELFGKWFRMLNDSFAPSAFVLTGGVMKSENVFFSDLRKAAAPSRLEKCALGQEAGLLGAAAYAWQMAK